jgi:GMP synthase-like glutamine amidotransferase
MKVHVLQHVANEGLGSIALWLAAQKAAVTFTHFYDQTSVLPSPDGFDLVIALGGPMSVNDEAQLPWLIAEKQFLRAVMQRGTAVLGICLGAQLIASACGARVYPNTEKEIGWFPVQGILQTENVFQFPEQTDVFHWHGETFALPQGAVHLARSAACENQAFQLGNNIIGLQFHLETDAESAKAFVDADNAEAPEKRELVRGKPYIQSAESILHAPAKKYADINALMESVLRFLLRV